MLKGKTALVTIGGTVCELLNVFADRTLLTLTAKKYTPSDKACALFHRHFVSRTPVPVKIPSEVQRLLGLQKAAEMKLYIRSLNHTFESKNSHWYDLELVSRWSR